MELLVHMLPYLWGRSDVPGEALLAAKVSNGAAPANARLMDTHETFTDKVPRCWMHPAEGSGRQHPGQSVSPFLRSLSHALNDSKL